MEHLQTACRLVGAAESPSFPGNARMVAAWFPSTGRGKASAIFNSAQYFAPVIFAPLTGWVAYSFGWRWTFFAMGLLGMALAVVWIKVIKDPDHQGVSAEEREDEAGLSAPEGQIGYTHVLLPRTPCHRKA